MNFNKMFFIFTLLTILFLSISSISANDVNNSECVDDLDVSDDIVYDNVISDVSDDVVYDNVISEVNSLETNKYYVNSSVDRSGDGSENNPFKTIKEAILIANESKNVEIYIASGVYNNTGNATVGDLNLNVALNHSSGGSLSFIGYGNSKPIIDGLAGNRFLTIGSSANVSVNNLNICNGFVSNSYGAGISNAGFLTIVNCVFVGNKANSGGAIYSSKNMGVYNSSFVNNSGSREYGAIYISTAWNSFSSRFIIDGCNFTDNEGRSRGSAISFYGKDIDENLVNNCLFDNNPNSIMIEYSNVTITNSKFINNHATGDSYYLGRDNGGVLYLTRESYANVKNCVFINNSAKNNGAVIYLQDNVDTAAIYLENNTVVNCSALNDNFVYVYTSKLIKSKCDVIALDNKTVYTDSLSVILNISVTDDNGNFISGPSVTFYFNNKDIGSVKLINGVATLNYKAFLNGTYILRSNFNTGDNVKTGTIIASPSENSIIYVSTEGNDNTGDGSELNPYKTIEKGYKEVSKTLNGILYIKNGNYTLYNYLDINTIGGNLSIIGYNGEVIINMNGTSRFSIISANSNVNIINLTFCNGKGTSSSSGVITSSGVLNLINCNFLDNRGSSSSYVSVLYINGGQTLIDNCTYKNNSASTSSPTIYTSSSTALLKIYNTIFLEDKKTEYVIISSRMNTEVDNCTFINVGRGIQVGAARTINLFDSKFINNTNPIYSTSNMVLLVNNSNFYYSGNIYSSSSTANNKLINSNFYNSIGTQGASIYISGESYIINCTFENCTATTSGAAIYGNYVNLFLENNTVINCSAPTDNYLYLNSGTILSKTVLNILNNNTYSFESFGVNLNATLVDDNNNPISGSTVTFYLNGTSAGNSRFVNGVANLYYKKYLDGKYIVTGSLYENTSVKTAIVNIVPLNNIIVYVSKDGNDITGDGSKDNPYLTFEKGWKEVQKAYNGILYIGEGIFDIYNSIEIDTGGGNLSIIGKGTSTILNIKSDGFITDISLESNVLIENITITNSTSNGMGGSIYNEGYLVINNSNFMNSYSSIVGGSIYNIGNLFVYNSKFINSSSRFEGGVIYNDGYLFLKNNTITDFLDNDYICTSGIVDNIILKFLDNTTYNINAKNVDLNVTITDDNGNIITATDFNDNLKVIFTLNGVNVGSSYLENGIATLNVNLGLAGKFILSGYMGNSIASEIKTSVLIFNNSDVLSDVYVAINGSDVGGNGTKNNPYATIGKAITKVSSINGIIHILGGSYLISSVININDFKNLTIIGENEIVVLRGSSNNRLFEISALSSVNLINLTLSNASIIIFGYQNTVFGGSTILNYGVLNLLDCIIEDNLVTFASGSWGNTVYGGAIYNEGILNINNSVFKSNQISPYTTNGQYFGGAIYNTGSLSIFNTTFDSNSLSALYVGRGGAIYSTGTLNIKASNFINNTISLESYYKNGGAIHSTGDLFIEDSIFKNNYAYGGSTIETTKNLYIYNSTFIIENNILNEFIIANGNFNKKIINSNFINSSGIKGLRFIQGNVLLDGNKFINNSIDILGSNFILINNAIGLIKNNSFIGNNFTNGIIGINGNSNVNISNNTFKNNNGLKGSIYVNGGNVNVFDNIFELNSADYGAVAYIYSGNLFIQNNTLENNVANILGDYIYVDGGKISGSKYTLKFNNNSTFYISGNIFKLQATLFDSEGNSIFGAYITFELNNTFYGKDRISYDNLAILVGSAALNGTYIVSGFSENLLNPNDCEIFTGLLVVEPLMNITIYVDSVFGSDTNNGSKDNPYLSLSKAISEAVNYRNATIYINGGEYSGELNTNLSILMGANNILRIIGLGISNDDKVVFDLKNKTNFLFDVESGSPSFSNASVIFENFEIINSNENTEFLFRFNNINSTLKSINFTNLNAKKLIIVGKGGDVLNIYNSIFFNHTTNYNSNNKGSLIDFMGDILIISDSSFINCSANDGSAISIRGTSDKKVLNYINNSNFINNTFNSTLMSTSLIYSTDTEINIYHSNFINNKGNGWGIISLSNSNLYGANDSFINNSAINGPAVIYASYLSNVNITDSFFIGNSLGVIRLTYSNGNISNSVIFNNSGTSYKFAALDYECKLILNNNWWGDSINPNEDPSFVSLGPGAILTLEKYVVLHVLSNVSNILPGDLVKLQLVFKDIDGNNLSNNLPARIANLIASNGLFTVSNSSNVSVAIVNNSAIVEFRALGSGNLTISVDNQHFTILIPKSATNISAIDLVEEFASKVIYNITLNNERGNPLSGVNVYLSVNDKEYTVITDSNGIASFDLGILNVGNYTVKYWVDGNDNFIASNGSSLLNITKVNNPNMNVDINVVGNNLTVTVDLPIYVSGNVTIKLNDTTVTVPIVNGTAIYKFNNLNYADYNLNVTYDGDMNYGSVSKNFKVEVKDKPIPNFSFILDDIVYGSKKVNVTINLPSTATGDVTIRINGKNYVVNLVNGQNKYIINLTDTLTPGSYPVQGSYSGDLNYSGNQNTSTLIVGKTIPVLNLTTNVVDNTVYVVVVLPSDATGTVTIKLGDKNETLTLVNGRASYNFTDIVPGSYEIIVDYSGDGNYVSLSKSANVQVTKKFNSNFSFVLDDIVYGSKEVNVTINLPIDATGNVILTINNVNYTVTLVSGQNKYTIILNEVLSHKNYNVLGFYSGDNKYADNQNTSTLIVNKAVPVLNSTVIVVDNTVSVVVVLPSDATGTVTIKLGDKNETLTLVNGRASYNFTDIAPNNYTLSVSYNGDNNYSPVNKTSNVEVINKFNPNFDFSINNIVYGDRNITVNVDLPADATGNLILNINGKNYNQMVIQGKKIYSFVLNETLNSNDYLVSLTYSGDSKYANKTVNKNLTVNKLSTSLQVNVSDVEYGEYGTIYVRVNPITASGKVKIIVNNVTYTPTIENGIAILGLPLLSPNTYTVSVVYDGDSNHKSSNASTSFRVKDSDNTTILKADDITMFFKNGTRYIVYLTDSKGNPLEGMEVVFFINNMNYTRTTGKDGNASIALNLNPDIYNTSVVFKGNNNYTGSFVNNTIEILPTLEGKDIVKLFRNGTQYYVKVLDGKGNPLKNTNVTMNINGVFYIRKTNDDGVAMLTINLNPGVYQLTVENPNDGLKLTNIVKVLSRIESNNITKYYRNGTQYNVKILDDNGNPLKNTNVTMNINGVFYVRKTNDEGIATLSINLNPGDYIITVDHPTDSSKISNTIKVLPTLKGEDVNMTLSSRKPYEVKLVDGTGKPQTGKNIRININGVFYNRVTGDDGIARLNINLDPKQYIATAEYEGYMTSNLIVVNG